MVELREFVAESLKQVIDGVADAQNYAKEKKAYINPQGLINLGTHYIVSEDSPKQHLIPQTLEFDIAVTASEGTEAKVGVGVFAAAIGFGTQAKLQDGNVTLSRIKFSIPLLFPQQILS